MARRHQYPGRPAFGYQPGHPYQNYGPYWENNSNYMPPLYGPNYPVDQYGYYYPPQHLVPPHYPQPWFDPNQHYPGQPPHYVPPGQYMPDQQQYSPQYNDPPGQNQSRRRRSPTTPYYAPAGPQPISQPPSPPPYQVSPETFPARSKKAGGNPAPHSRPYPQQRELAIEPQVQPEPPQSSPGKPTDGSNKPSYKNWPNYKGKK